MRRLSALACAVLVASTALIVITMVREAVPAPPGRTKVKPAVPPPPPPTPPPPPPPPPPLGVPFQGLSPADLQSWNVGKGAFQQAATPSVGLGPVYTESACSTCHNAGAIGGSGTRLVTHFGTLTNGVFDPLVEFGGPQLQDRGIGKFNGVNFVGEIVPPEATIVAQRRTLPLFGLGLVDAVPDSIFLAIAEHQSEFTPATAGRANIVTDPVTGATRVGKFGWKAQEPTILAFVTDANVNELGVTTPVFPNENCPQGNCALLAANPAHTNPNNLTLTVQQQQANFVTFTAPPPPGPAGASVQAGAVLFAQIGCANCHTPSLQTGGDESAALNGVTFSPYSDFLLHNMGSLGDGIAQNGAGQAEMRTAPLWGLRFEPSLLHDGRAKTPDQAIRAHAGQGQAAANNYVGLSSTQQAQLIAFLNSL